MIYYVNGLSIKEYLSSVKDRYSHPSDCSLLSYFRYAVKREKIVNVSRIFDNISPVVSPIRYAPMFVDRNGVKVENLYGRIKRCGKRFKKELPTRW